MRLFVAVPLPESVQNEVLQSLRGLSAWVRDQHADVKWVKPDHLHLTLKFLGDCGEDRLPEIEAGLKTAVQGMPPFTVGLSGMGGFPEKGPLRILWVGVEDGKLETEELALRVELACEPLGFFKEDRAFSAHLTVGRVKSGKHAAAVRSFMQGNNIGRLNGFTVDSIALMQSVLSSAGPEYSVLRVFLFQKMPQREL